MLTSKQLIACGFREEEAKAVNALLAEKGAAACWPEVSRNILSPKHPFALHQLLYETVYATWDAETQGATTGLGFHLKRISRKPTLPS